MSTNDTGGAAAAAASTAQDSHLAMSYGSDSGGPSPAYVQRHGPPSRPGTTVSPIRSPRNEKTWPTEVGSSSPRAGRVR